MAMPCTRGPAAALLAIAALAEAAPAQECQALASMAALGAGTTGSAGVPELQPLGGPMIGEPGMGLRLTQGAPSAPALVLAGAPAAPVRLPAYGAQLHVGAPLLRFPVQLGPDGISSVLHSGPAPTAPALCGLELAVQGVVADGAAQGGLAFTAALRLRFGEGAAAARLFLGMGAAVPAALDGLLEAGIDVADLDGNGHLDVVAPAAAGPDSSVNVLLQLDDGSLWNAARWPSGGTWPIAVELTDVDGDGLEDAVVCNSYDFGTGFPPTGNLAVLRGLGGRDFGAPEPYPIAGQPNGVVAADLDGDARPDLACTEDDTDLLVVLPNTGGGTFGAPLTFALPGQPKLRALDAADLDGDRLDDLIVRCTVGASFLVDEVVVYRSLGGFSFAPPQRVPLDAYTSSGTAVGDLDGDLDLDVAVSMLAQLPTEAGVRVLLNSSGQLGPAAPLGPAGYTLGVQIADLDGDGDADVLADQQDGTLVLEQAGGQFAPATTLDLTGVTRVADMDLDGRLDLVSCRSALFGLVGWIDWIAGRGEFRFGLPAAITGFAPSESELVDLDGDGRLDLVGNTPEGTVAVVLGQAAAEFGPAAAYDAGGYVRTLAVGDLDHDGRPDLVVTHFSASIAVLRGAAGGTFGPPTVIPLANADRVRLSDVNADGDLDALVSRLGLGSPTLAVLLGAGDGSLQSPLLTGPSTFLGPFSVGDVDEDGDPDVVYHNSFGLWLTRGAGDGSFGAAEVILFDGGGGPSALADLDGDGHLDLVVPFSGTWVRVLRGDGQGHFTPIGVIPASFRERLDVVDVNSDGALDLVGTGVALGFGDGTFAPYQPGDVGGPLGDLDGDGDLDGCAHGRLFLNALH